MPVIPHAFWCLHTESSFVWCVELRFLLPIHHESLFSHLDLLICLDYMLGYATDADRLIATVESLFDVCLEKSLKLNPRKCYFAALNVHFCRRIINSKRIKFYPRQYEALMSTEPPKIVGALMELIDGANWMRTAIPRFSVPILHVQDTTEIENLLSPSPGMGDELTAAFSSLISRRLLVNSRWQLLTLLGASAPCRNCNVHLAAS